MTIYNIKDNLLKEDWEKIFSNNIENIKFIPIKFQTVDMLKELIDKNKINEEIFKIIKSDLLKEEDYYKMFLNNIENIKFIPIEFQTIDMLKELINKNKINQEIFEIIKSDLLKEEDYYKMFSNNIENIKFIPWKFQTKELILQFLNENNNIYYNYNFLNTQFFDQTDYDMMFFYNINNRYLIPKKFITKEMIIKMFN